MLVKVIIVTVIMTVIMVTFSAAKLAQKYIFSHGKKYFLDRLTAVGMSTRGINFFNTMYDQGTRLTTIISQFQEVIACLSDILKVFSLGD